MGEVQGQEAKVWSSAAEDSTKGLFGGSHNGWESVSDVVDIATHVIIVNSKFYTSF